MSRQFDLIVIGAGAGGEVAAYLMARAGKKVAIIEADTPGGECPNYGCVPTKSLLHAADIFREAKNGAKFGVAAEPHLHYHKLKAWKDTAVRRTGTSHAEEMYKSEGIHAIHGRATFVSPWEIEVGSKRYAAKQFLIATGSDSFIPPISGLADVDYITYRQAIDLTALPDSIFVIGGGAIGCEFAELFGTFGSKVSIADIAPRLVMPEDPEIGEFIRTKFTQKGIKVHTASKVIRVAYEPGSKRKVVHYQSADNPNETHQTTVDTVLVASGKIPNVNVGLAQAGVMHDRGGILTDKFMRTTAKHIYAAGDVVGPYRFTHTASYQSRLAAHNMLHPRQKQKVDYSAIPRAIFIDPEVAGVGLTEHELTVKLVKYQTGTAPINFIGRANTSDVNDGFVKVIADPKGRLLGASIASPRAGEMIHELALAIKHRMKASDVAETVHAYPTWSEAVRLACQRIKS